MRLQIFNEVSDQTNTWQKCRRIVEIKIKLSRNFETKDYSIISHAWKRSLGRYLYFHPLWFELWPFQSPQKKTRTDWRFFYFLGFINHRTLQTASGRLWIIWVEATTHTNLNHLPFLFQLSWSSHCFRF